MLALCLFVGLSMQGQAPLVDGQTLEDQLRSESLSTLARDARRLGNATRGAIAFHQAHLACARCHVGEVDQPPLGPDLAQLGKSVTDEHLVDSILNPSREIKKGFATVKVATKGGQAVTGLLASETDREVVLIDLANEGRRVRISKDEIDERSDSDLSSMPTGLVNGLKSRGQFLDLITYLRAIADGGPARAKALRPSPSLLAPPPLPDYERDIDHAGLIADLGPESLERGRSIYLRVCANCHGTAEQAGSMPTSLRFGSGAFKKGGDPFSMYETITRGFGQMPAQPWMVPRQKYDVIHYIREAYLKPGRAVYTPVDRAYLAKLPRGSTKGPEASNLEPWSEMDYGPSLMATYEIGESGKNLAYKGIAMRLDRGPGGVAKGRAWAVYDHDSMRLAAFWTGSGFIDWNGIGFNGRHGTHARVAGIVRLESPEGPGWADPRTGSLEDPRARGRDGRRYGPMPREWMKYRGLHRHGDRSILSYTVGAVEVLDSVELAIDSTSPVLARTLEVGPSDRELRVILGGEATPAKVAGGLPGGASIRSGDGRTVLAIPASATARTIKVLLGADSKSLEEANVGADAGVKLSALTKGGPTQWPARFETSTVREPTDGPFGVDILAHPLNTPWHSQMRFTGLDFEADDKGLVVCDWDGDVWRVAGLDRPDGRLTWRRIGSGLFQPLGLKIVDGAIYVNCRDQIVILRDRNGDGETDFYECFNDDHQVTDHFHEFAMDLQTDAEGNFYYTKGARHALKAVVPQHGTLLRVSKDGTRTDILANGFRAPNGVCINPDGTFFVTDQEGHWTPKNRVNWVKPGHFYGNLWGFTDVTDPSDSAMEPPICWITNAFDRSPAQVMRVDDARWSPLNGHHLILSYGYGKVFLLLEETVGDLKQGGLVELPIPQFPTGLIRGRFNAEDGALYTCGMFAWAGNQQQPGGLYRIRRTEAKLNTPVGLSVIREGIAIRFSEPLAAGAVAKENFKVSSWGLARSEQYGSKHVDEKERPLSGVSLSSDGRSVTLQMPDLGPTRGMAIDYKLKAADGSDVEGVIHNTIHDAGRPVAASTGPK